MKPAYLGPIQRALEAALGSEISAEKLLIGMLSRAAVRQNLAASEVELQHLAVAFLNAEGEMIQIDLDPPCFLGKTEAEAMVTVQALLDDLTTAFPAEEQLLSDALREAIPETLAEVADAITKDLFDESTEHLRRLKDLESKRAREVEELWGGALERLDMLRHLTQEWDATAQKLRKGSYARSMTAYALGRLLWRAHEVTGEVIALARMGYADGALARWRSLHELCVIAMFLGQQSGPCAEMYLSHHKIEELRLLKVDRASGSSGVFNLHRDRYARELRQQQAILITRFGKAFAADYGWAAVELGRARVTFKDLEQIVGLDTLRRGYQQANAAVHGGALATLTRISLGAQLGRDVDSPTAYGCEIAANYAAASLTMLVAELSQDTEDADLFALLLVIKNCADELQAHIERFHQGREAASLRERLRMRKAARRRRPMHRLSSRW